ncbi:MAG: PAS domain S-box protein, partial [Proteobacteria bacterium]|nr:PAS domain S-box protein [Pseudomonadota bacterium]
MQPEAETRIGVLSRICDAVLIAMSVLVVPALAASLARIETIGWQPLMALHGFMTLGIWTVMLLRRRLPYGVRSWFVVGVLIAIGLLGIGTFGLIGSAGIFIPFAAVLASILLGHRAGGFVLVVTILAAGVIATPLVLGQWLPDFDLVAYATSPSAWVAEGFAWLMLGGICIVALGILNSYFVETVTTTKRQAEALELSQREYRDIFENLVDTVYRADLDGKILTISPSIMDMLGFEPEEVIGKKLSDFYVTPSNRDELVADLQVTDGDVRNFEAQMYHRNGQPQWISTNVRYWKDIDGSVLGVEGVARNISSHKAGEEALQRSQKMEALRNLTGGVAHDFNNLLGVIIGHAELLAEDSATSTPVDENVVEILQAAEQAAVLTRRLLTFARPEMLAAEPVTLNEVIHGLVGTMRRALGERVTLRLDLGTQDAETLVDLPELRTALLNLAINSREAMLNGGELTIETTNTTIDTVAAGSMKGLEPGDYLRVVVRDNGAGMTDETARNAIEPFFTTKPLSAGK